jgi:hypothetical protein
VKHVFTLPSEVNTLEPKVKVSPEFSVVATTGSTNQTGLDACSRFDDFRAISLIAGIGIDGGIDLLAYMRDENLVLNFNPVQQSRALCLTV